MKLEDFRQLDESSDKYNEILDNFCVVQLQIEDVFNEVFINYKSNKINIGESFGKGPLYQFANEIVKEFIRKL